MSPRGRRATLLALVAGSLAMGGLASGQASSELIRELEATKQHVLRARVRAAIRTTSGQSTTITHWAWSKGKNHSLDLLRSSSGMSESVWDGKRAMSRYTATDLPASAPPQAPFVSVTTDALSVSAGAIQRGYWLMLTRPFRISWVVDIARRSGITSEKTSGGLVRVHVPSNIGGKRIIELNPKWDYMVVVDRDFEETRQRSRTGVISRAMETEEFRVREAKSVGGCWIPTKWESRTIEAYGPSAQTSFQSVSELTSISTNVLESEFAPLGQPGDKVQEGGKIYVIGPSGKRTLAPPERSLLQAAPVVVVKPVPSEFHPPTLKILGVAAAVFIGVEVVLMLRRSRRRSADYWGPPGQSPGGPKG